MNTTKYSVEEDTEEWYGTTKTIYRVVRTDGTPYGWGPGTDPRLPDRAFGTRSDAEMRAKFLENTPAGYCIQLDQAYAHDRRLYWILTGSADGDPQEIRWSVLADWTPEGTAWPADTQIVDLLIKEANDHAAGAAARIARKAERDATAAAEAIVREARAAQLAEARRTKGELATPRQVEYILQLLDSRQRSGVGGGFFYGPTDRAAIEEMSKADASTYITSLTERY